MRELGRSFRKVSRPSGESGGDIFELGRLRRGEPTNYIRVHSRLKLTFPTPYPMHRFPFGFPLDLEIGFGVKEGIVIPWKDFE